MKHFFKLTPILVLLVLAVTYSTSIPAMAKSDYWTDSGAQYSFYLDYMFPKRNVGPKPAVHPVKKVTVDTRTVYDYSPTPNDFYLDWMRPRIEPDPMSRKTIRFLTRQATDAENQFASNQNNK